jgi:hypothetical protein
MRSMRFLCRLALPVVILVSAAGAAGAQSPEIQQACTPDAMRLCGQFIPDRERVTACMKAHHREWSEACRTAILGGRRVARGRVHRHREHRHRPYRHERHERHYRHRHER